MPAPSKRRAFPPVRSARRAFPPEKKESSRRALPPARSARRAFPPEKKQASRRRAFPPKRWEPPEFHGSVYQRWAAAFFHRNRWRALPWETVADLLQDAYFKYARCVQLYVHEQWKARTPKALMNFFKRACDNMLTDQSRKKMRRPEAYYYEQVNPDTQLDQTLVTIEAHL